MKKLPFGAILVEKVAILREKEVFKHILAEKITIFRGKVAILMHLARKSYHFDAFSAKT